MFVFVKAKQDKQIQWAGIACAVEMVVRGKKKFFLLTCAKAKTLQGRVFAKRCYGSWFKTKPNAVEVGDGCVEDQSFCFIPLDFTPKKSFELISPENIGKQSKCRSFVVSKSSLETIKWKYNTNDQRYQLQKETDLEESVALGLPVLWTDAGRSYVAGVVSRKENGFFSRHVDHKLSKTNR